MTKIFSRFIKDESGATAIEYGLIAALIAIAIIGGARVVGGNINAKFEEVGAAIGGAGGEDGGGQDGGGE